MSAAAVDCAGVAGALQQALQQALDPVYLQVHDDSAAHAGHAGAAGGKGHFRLRIVSMRFLGMKQLQRHRMVNELLAPFFDTHVHALAMETLTPEEFKSRSNLN